MKTREKMIRHCHSVNKPLTKEWLSEQTDEILLANCHPIDRERYKTDLKLEKPKAEEL